MDRGAERGVRSAAQRAGALDHGAGRARAHGILVARRAPPLPRARASGAAMTAGRGDRRPARGATTSAVGALLRQWRERRRMSQLSLAVEAEISARHLSFLETGRAQPSREMLLLLARTLDVPLRGRNELLTAAGYAPVHQ